MIILLFFSLLAGISALSEGSSYYFVISFMGIICFYLIRIKLNLTKVFTNLLFILFLMLLFSFSYLNGGSVLLSTLKSFQFFILMKIIFDNGEYNIDYKKLRRIFTLFIVFCILFGLIFIINDPIYGTARYRGFFFDPNYFGATCLVLLVVLNYIKSINAIKNIRIEIILYLGILLSLSSTILSAFCFYKIFSSQALGGFLKKVSIPLLFLILLFSPFSSYFIELILDQLNNFDEISLEYFIYKISSLNQRFYLQSFALDMVLNNPYSFLFGFGTGRTLEYLPQALHNGYLQLIFSHGFLIYIIFCLLTFRMLFLIKNNYHNNQYVLSGFFSLLLINNFIDIFFSSLLSILFLLSNIVLSWYKIPKKSINQFNLV